MNSVADVRKHHGNKDICDWITCPLLEKRARHEGTSTNSVRNFNGYGRRAPRKNHSGDVSASDQATEKRINGGFAGTKREAGQMRDSNTKLT